MRLFTRLCLAALLLAAWDTAFRANHPVDGGSGPSIGRTSDAGGANAGSRRAARISDLDPESSPSGPSTGDRIPGNRVTAGLKPENAVPVSGAMGSAPALVARPVHARFSSGSAPDAPMFVLAMDEYMRRDRLGIDHLEILDPPATPETLATRLAALQKEDQIYPVAYPEKERKSAGTRRLVTPDIRVGVAAGMAADLAARHFLQPVPSPALSGDTRLFRAKDSFAALAVAEILRADANVRDARVVLAANRFKRALPNDPLAASQWHLKKITQSAAGTDVNVESVWNYPGSGNRGAGVRIGIIDDGIQTAHPDFAGNIDTTNDKDWNQNDNDPNPVAADDNHGTACAGNSAARGNNSLGVTGSAPEATLVGLRLIGGATTDIMEAEAMLYRNDIIAVKNNSWGPEDTGFLLEEPGPDTQAALQSACANGRGGLGTIFLFAGGNGAEEGDNSNKDGYANSIHTIAVGAINSLGKRSAYSERGANLVVCAPSDDSESTLAITTTDRTGTNGYNAVSTASGGDYTTNSFATGFGGTSSATPTVAGIVALMLRQNPNLGWRDVQEILIQSAVKVDPGDPEWIVNGAGHHFNHNYGAGLVDAAAAVALSGTWTNLAAPTSISSSQTGLSVAIPDNNATGISRTFTIAPSSLRAEHVTMTLDITHTARGNLDIRLVSPSGTESRLAEVHGDTGDDYANWKFSTVRNWGEPASGTWTLKISDRAGGNTGKLNAATMVVHGSMANLPPTITAATLSANGIAYADQAVAVQSVTASDPENNTLGFTYQWESSGDGVTFLANGPTGAVLPANPANAAKLWRCVITASDGNSSGASFTTVAVNVVARPPATAQAGSAFAYTSGLVLAAGNPAPPRPAIINEFSQGPSGGNSEWVEILTLGETSLASWRLRESAGNTIVFSGAAVWDAVPAGTCIVVYNGSQPKDSTLPADDLNPLDDRRMVVSSTNTTYFEAGLDSWIILGNLNDAIFLTDPTGGEIDSISYGSNATGVPQISPVAGGRAATFTGNSSAGAELVENWTILSRHTLATPGAANGGMNTTWVNSLRTASAAVFRIGAGSIVPSGLTLDTATGLLSGTIGSAVTPGNYPITIERTNGTGTVVSQSFTLAISSTSGYTAWIAGFSGLSSASETADPDRDGLPNLIEYLLYNQNPKVPDASAAMQSSVAGGQLRLSWRESKSATGAVLEPQWSPSLLPASWLTTGITVQTLEDLPASRLRQATVPVTSAYSKRFLRLRARPSP